MRRALVVGYFKVNQSLIDFYNVYARVGLNAGVQVIGVELGGISDGSQPCQFEIQKLTVDRLSVGHLRYLPSFSWGVIVSNRGSVYSEMQAQSKTLVQRFKSYCRLCIFKKKFGLLVENLGICHVLLNHQFSGYHLIARDVCLQKAIPFTYWHPGFLPGTMSFDLEGQMAESAFAKSLNSITHNRSREWMELGAAYVTQAVTGKYRRTGKSYGIDDFSLRHVKEFVDSHEKVLLVIGANDYRTGVLPVDYEHSYLHSPHYKDSSRLFEDVLEVVDENTCVIYKPHPNTANGETGVVERGSNALVVYDLPLVVLFPYVDLSISICSAGVYESLIFSVPVLLVGNVPGCGLGFFNRLCVGKEALSSAIISGTTRGYTADNREKFYIFVGYCLSEYFFSSGTYACDLVQNDAEEEIYRIFTGAELGFR